MTSKRTKKTSKRANDNAESPSSQPAFFDNPLNIKRVLLALYIICGVLMLLDLIVHRHITHSWEKLPGFYPLYGFVGCVVLVLIAKEMRKVLMRGEDYYDDADH